MSISGAIFLSYGMPVLRMHFALLIDHVLGVCQK